MYVIDEENYVEVYPFCDSDGHRAFSGRVMISKDTECAPDVAGRLQLNIIFGNGATLDQWNALKEAGDKAFELAGITKNTTNGFPFESHEYEREFYNGTVLDGWRAGDTSEKFDVLSDAIKRAVERSTDDDVWGVYQVGKDYDGDGYREDRIVALVFKQNVYLFEPEPKCHAESKEVEVISAL